MLKKSHFVITSLVAIYSTNLQAVELNTYTSSCSGNSVNIALDNADRYDNNDLEFYVFISDIHGDYTSKRKTIKPGSLLTDGSTYNFRFYGYDDINYYTVFSFDSRFTPRQSEIFFCN